MILFLNSKLVVCFYIWKDVWNFEFLEFLKTMRFITLSFGFLNLAVGWDFSATFLFPSFVSPSRRSSFAGKEFFVRSPAEPVRVPDSRPISQIITSDHFTKWQRPVLFCSLGERPQWKDAQVKRKPLPRLGIVCWSLEMPGGKRQSKKINVAPFGSQIEGKICWRYLAVHFYDVPCLQGYGVLYDTRKK